MEPQETLFMEDQALGFIAMVPETTIIMVKKDWDLERLQL
jgi:hypothetical protein